MIYHIPNITSLEIEKMKYSEDEITVILSVWKRNNLKKQLNHILNQTKKPYQIWIYQNESHMNIDIPDQVREKFKISIIQSKNINFKFHGRFALPLLCDTEYTAIFDDDTIPGTRWLENCLDTSKRNNAIITANARNVRKDYDKPGVNNMLGFGPCDGQSVEKEVEIDTGGHCWFFKTDWVRYMWMDRPYSWDNGEDIHFAAAAQVYGGIKSFLPRMPADDLSLWGDLEPQLGADEIANWRRNDHLYLRGEIVKYWCEKGWRPIALREEEG